MRHLSSGVAVAALLITSALIWPPSSAAEQLAAAPASDGSTTSAMPPTHRHARTQHHMVKHGAAAGHRMAKSNPNTMANQLNQQELSRLQTGSSMAPPPPAAEPTSKLQGPRPSSGR